MRLLFALALLVLALLLVGFLLLVRPAWSATRYTTGKEKTLDRLGALGHDDHPATGAGLHGAHEPHHPAGGGALPMTPAAGADHGCRI
jgi:hypothetical protein